VKVFALSFLQTIKECKQEYSMNKRYTYAAVALGLIFILAAVLWQESQSIFSSKVEPTHSPIPSATPTSSPTLKVFNKTATATFDIPSSNFVITYFSNKTLTVNGQALWNPDCSLEITYRLDGAGLHTIPCVIKPLPAMMGYAISFSGNLEMSQLNAGEHSIEVYGKISWTKVSTANATLAFIV
jgi:hypothetical protein